MIPTSDKLALIARLTFWAALAVVTWLMLTPMPPQTIVSGVSDKLQHVFAFAALAGAAAIGWPSRRMMIFSGLCALGVMLELLQLLVPGRAFELLDMLADCAGVGLFALILRIMQRQECPA